MWREGWKSGYSLDMAKEMMDQWNHYTLALMPNVYTPKVGYIWINVVENNREQKWWWR